MKSGTKERNSSARGLKAVGTVVLVGLAFMLMREWPSLKRELRMMNM